MSAARTCELLFQTLGRAPTTMTAEVYNVLKKDQARNTFVQCHVSTFKEFRTLGLRMQKTMRHASQPLRCNVVWQGEIVTMCEMRQSAQRYTWQGLEKVVKELEHRGCRRLRRRQQSILLKQPYVGMCHASYMFTYAIKVLNLHLPVSRTGSGPALGEARAWKLLLDAVWDCVPK